MAISQTRPLAKAVTTTKPIGTARSDMFVPFQMARRAGHRNYRLCFSATRPSRQIDAKLFFRIDPLAPREGIHREPRHANFAGTGCDGRHRGPRAGRAPARISANS